MATKGNFHLRCPICKKPVKAADHDFPFCSERCRLFDLGNWASGQYAIPSALADDDKAIPVISDSPDDPEGEG